MSSVKEKSRAWQKGPLGGWMVREAVEAAGAKTEKNRAIYGRLSRAPAADRR